MKMKGGYAGKILNVDLSNHAIRTERLGTEKIEGYIGGKGYAARLLWERTPANLDPLGPDNLLIFATGPLTGTLCPSTRMCIVTKSPLTGTFDDSYVGGRLGHEIKFAGYDFLIIRGKAEKPVYLWINDENIEILDAAFLWGEDTFRVDELIRKKLNNENVCTACIGPAGEKLVRYASINVEKERQAARGGVGTVMGSKNLKAVAVLGSGNVKVADFDAFHAASLEVIEAIAKNSTAHSVYKNYGTARSVEFASDQDIFATRNYQAAEFEEAENLGGNRQRKDFWIKDHACYGCPISCSHIGLCRAPEFEGTLVEGIDFEVTSLLGSNNGLGNLEAVAYANMLCDKLGLDALSTGNVIGWTMECYERGILSDSDTSGLKLTFGDYKAQIETIKKIAHREGIGDLLAEGVKRAAEKLGKGSEQFAMHVKGLELAAWGIRGSPGMGLAYATADRGGCHQRAWPTAYEVIRGRQHPGGTGKKAVAPDGLLLDRYSWEGKALVTILMQDENAALWTLVACDFATGYVGIDRYVKLLNSATGSNLDKEQFIKVGERIWNLVRVFNIREGIRRKDDTLPPRIFKESLPSGLAKGRKLGKENFDKMLAEYYQIREWDTETGFPIETKLNELGLNDVAKELKKLESEQFP